VDWRAATSPRVGHIGPNWVTIFVCLFLSSIAYLYCFDYTCGVALHIVLDLFCCCCLETLYLLITTSFAPHIFVIHWCDFGP